jgi:hypothetical protein
VVKDILIYDLIFSDKTEFSIDIGSYINDIYMYEEFINEIKNILRISKVSIINNSLDVGSRTVIWKIKVKR